MSQLQSIASRLRSLAQDATPLSANVEASARQLKALGQQVESLRRAGVDVGPLVAALRVAEQQAHAAAEAASRVKADGVAWADDLARGVGNTTSRPIDRSPAAGDGQSPQSVSQSGVSSLDDVRTAVPAGSAFLGKGDDQFAHDWPQHLPRHEFEHAVVIHGNPRVVGVKHPRGVVQTASADDLNDALPQDGKAVRLFSCSTGQEPDGFAQQLADVRGTTVIAPTHTVFMRPGGDYFIGEHDPVTNKVVEVGGWKSFFPRDGAI